ncbi:MAG TPA: YciI family protein [Candidatus Angelobacter sp.]|nr:YciI family protein [Candidatus Angelobacter sp.]
MRYMLLIYTREDALAKSSQEEMQRLTNEHWAVMREARAKGVLEAAEPLAGTSTATTVRLQNGAPVITDGPFAETKEQLAGYYILNCENLDEAVAWARKIPTGCGGLQGCVEIRPLREIPVSSKVEEGVNSNRAHG